MDIYLMEKDLSGGKISINRIRTALDSHQQVNLTISGLRQDSLEFLVNNYAEKILKINFRKCPRLEDLSPLESLVKATKIEVWWNQKAQKIWEVSKNSSLKTLHLTDLKKVTELNTLSASQSIEKLYIDGGMWNKNTYESLDPLINIPKLRVLGFGAKLRDNRIEPISKIKHLEEISFPPNLFKTEQIAWLKAKLPSGIKSDILAPFENYRTDLSSGEIVEVLIIGKRKPFINPQAYPQKFENYVNKFNKLYEFYLKNPNEKEPT